MLLSPNPSELAPGDEWELRHEDDGFIYKILKRQRLLSDPSSESQSSAVTDLKAEENRRRKRKHNTICKLRKQYQAELSQWEVLSNSLRAMQQKTVQHQQESQRRHQETPQAPSCSDQSESASGSLIDELILQAKQAEAQEAIINDVGNLCDMVEAMCNAQQDKVVKSFMDLPIWASPRELMASLCDD